MRLFWLLKFLNINESKNPYPSFIYVVPTLNFLVLMFESYLSTGKEDANPLNTPNRRSKLQIIEPDLQKIAT